MKYKFFSSVLFLLFPLSVFAQSTGGNTLPEPLSFPGTPAASEKGFANLSIRVATQQDVILGVEIDSTLSAFILEARGRISPLAQVFATVPIGSLSVNDPVFGQNTETDLANPAVGVLFTPLTRGNARAAFGVSVGIPVADDDAASALALFSGSVVNHNNRILFSPNVLSLRPEARIGIDAGILSFQTQVGLDFGLDTNNNNNLDEELSVLRGGVSAGIRPISSLAFLAELSFSDDFNNDNNNALTIFHLGGRGILPTNTGGAIQPGIEVFLPLNDFTSGFFNLGVAFDIRASF